VRNNVSTGRQRRENDIHGVSSVGDLLQQGGFESAGVEARKEAQSMSDSFKIDLAMVSRVRTPKPFSGD